MNAAPSVKRINKKWTEELERQTWRWSGKGWHGRSLSLLKRLRHATDVRGDVRAWEMPKSERRPRKTPACTLSVRTLSSKSWRPVEGGSSCSASSSGSLASSQEVTSRRSAWSLRHCRGSSPPPPPSSRWASRWASRARTTSQRSITPTRNKRVRRVTRRAGSRNGRQRGGRRERVVGPTPNALGSHPSCATVPTSVG